MVVEPVDVATAHQISSAIAPFTVSTYRLAKCHALVLGQLTPVMVMLCVWICDEKTTRSPTFCGDTVMVAFPRASEFTGKPAAREIDDPAANAVLSNPTAKIDDIIAMDTMLFNARPARFPGRRCWPLTKRLPRGTKI